MSAAEFRDILQKLQKNEQKGIIAKYKHVNRATLLFSCDEVRQEIIDDEDLWLEAFQCISAAVKYECDDNIGRLADHKRSSSFKHDIFHLYRDMIKLQIQELISSVDLDSLIKGLLEVLQKHVAIKALDASTNETWSTTLNLIIDILEIYSPIDLSYYSFKTLYDSCINYLEDSVDNNSAKSERAKLTNILVCIAESLHNTYLFTKVDKILVKISEICSKFGWNIKDPTRTPLMTVVNLLIENNTVRHRDLLIEKFLPLAEKLCENLELLSSNEFTQFANLSPMKRIINEDVNDFPKTLYLFVENMLVLVYPDCELVGDYDASCIVKQASDVLFRQLDEKIRRSYNNKNIFVLPQVKLRFLARLLVLDYLINKNESQSSDSLCLAKRQKLSNYLMDFSSNSKYSQLQILEELLIRWRHKLCIEDLDEISRNIAHLEKNALKKDDKLDLYLRLLALLLEEERHLSTIHFTQCQIYQELWNFGMSLIQLPSTHDSACIFLSSILPYFTKVLQIKPLYIWRNISFQLAQFNSYRKNTLRLMQIAIQTFEFDERMMFHVDKQYDSEWCFREQLLSSVIEFSNAEAEDVIEVIKTIIMYHPKQIKMKLKNYREIIPSQFEKLLTKYYCLNCYNEKLYDDSIDDFSNDSIPCLLESLMKYLVKFWNKNSSDIGRRIFLWKITVLSIKNFISSNLDITILEDFEDDIAEALDNNEITDIIIQNLDIGILWKYTTNNLRRKIEQLADDSNEVCMRYKIYWSIDVQLSKGLLENVKIVDSGNLDKILLENLDSLSIEDFLLLLRRFGSNFKLETNVQIIHKALDEIESEYALNKNAHVSFAQKERLFYIVCENVNLNGINKSLFNILFNCTDNPGIESSNIPLYLLNDEQLEKLLRQINGYAFCKLLKSALNDFSNRIIPEPILKNMLAYDISFLKKYIESLPELIKIFQPILAIYIKNGELSVKSSWKRQLRNVDESLIKILTGVDDQIDDSLSPLIFCLPYGWINNLYTIEKFNNNWLNWKENLEIYYYIFMKLRVFIYELKQYNFKQINYPMIILNNLILMVEKKPSIVEYPYYSDEIVSLCLILFSDAMKLCSDDILHKLLSQFLNLFIDSELSIIKALIIVDMFEEKSEEFPICCEKLKSIENTTDNYSLNLIKQYANYVFSDYSSENEPQFLREDVNKYIEMNNTDIDILEFSAQTKGFWKIIKNYTECTKNKLIIKFIMPYWMFYPKLRPILTEILVLFPDDIIKPILKDHRYFVYAFKHYNDFVPLIIEISTLLLFDPLTVQNSSIISNLYKLIISIVLQKK